jgi:ubiquinone/menaquinone biosynthesis C-methylase UbiE
LKRKQNSSLIVRATKELFKIESCTGIDLSEDMLNVAEQLERKIKIERERKS